MTVVEQVREANEQAHQQAVREDIARIAQFLQETLGQKLTAYAAGVKDPKAIGKYARGDHAPREETEARLRNVFRVTQLLLTGDSPATVRAWMIGSNPQLDDDAPIELLHETQVRPVLRAAEAFLMGG
jgi:hypothetical protein